MFVPVVNAYLVSDGDGYSNKDNGGSLLCWNLTPSLVTSIHSWKSLSNAKRAAFTAKCGHSMPPLLRSFHIAGFWCVINSEQQCHPLAKADLLVFYFWKSKSMVNYGLLCALMVVTQLLCTYFTEICLHYPPSWPVHIIQCETKFNFEKL